MPLSIREVSRRGALAALGGLAACNRKAKGNALVGRWEGKLNNGLSTLPMQFDFAERKKDQMELRVTARDLFLSSHPLATWKLAAGNFEVQLPAIEGQRNFRGSFSGPTFDIEDKTTGEKIHMRQFGRVPALPYQEIGPEDLRPTNRSVRAKAFVQGQSSLLRHFHADLIAKMGVEAISKATPGAGWFFVQDQEIPTPVEGLPFLMVLSPSRERINRIAEFPCPIFVLLGESDDRFQNLERGTRQVAFELREALAKKGRKMDSFQISVAPQADRTLRVRGYEKEYPKLGPNYLEHFRRFFARFDTSV